MHNELHNFHFIMHFCSIFAIFMHYILNNRHYGEHYGLLVNQLQKEDQSIAQSA